MLGGEGSRALKIYTKQGDRGQTVLFDGTRVAKDDLRIETYGTMDELNSAIGLAMAECQDQSLNRVLEELQRQLLDLGSDLATPPGSKNRAKVRRIGPGDVAWAERQIDAATAELPPLKRFILPGGGVTAARLHVARTICRRGERLLVKLMAQAAAGDAGSQHGLENALIYINRLSDLLFTLARLANSREGRHDVEWDGKRAREGGGNDA
jgi:cob(I)alamin adenosyltransferase